VRRHENRSTIMTSNRPLEDWGKLLSDVPTAGAILDRFLHHAELITIAGRSYRLRNQMGGAPSGPGAPAQSETEAPSGKSARKRSASAAVPTTDAGTTAEAKAATVDGQDRQNHENGATS